jgi:integrase
VLLSLSATGDDGAFAAAVALVMGLRAKEIIQRVVPDVDAFSRVLYIEKAKTAAGNRMLKRPKMLWPHFESRIQGKNPMDTLLLGQSINFHRSDWVRYQVLSICKELKLSACVCAQGLRGTHSSFAQETGVTAQLVAQQLGHESEETTLEHCTRPGLPEEQKSKRVLRVLTGGLSS